MQSELHEHGKDAQLIDKGRADQRFERALIVERSRTDPNRLNALVSPSFVNQLRIFAVLVQFRLHGAERVVA